LARGVGPTAASVRFGALSAGRRLAVREQSFDPRLAALVIEGGSDA
jgi:hypothetical protein